MDIIALILAIVGGLNWGLVGIFRFDLIAFLFGNMSILTRIIYVLAALGGIWSITFFFREHILSRYSVSDDRG